MAKPNLSSINRNIPTFNYWVQKVLPAVYDESLSHMELLAKVVHQLNDMGELTNNMVSLWNDVNEWVVGDGIGESVSDRLDQMADDGTLDEIINVSIFEGLNQTINDNKKLVDTRVEGVEQKLKVKKGNTFGTFDNAALESVIANKPNNRVEVLGITMEEDYKLSEYDNRDSVASYRSNSTRKPTLDINGVNYSVTAVTVPVGTDLSKVQYGMIIDTKHIPKFSAFVVGTVDNIIQVKNWYKMGNPSKGQVPTNTAGMIVNPITKVWVDNVNLYLEKDDPYSAGSAVEYGVINNQADGGDTTGVDVVSLGDNKPSNAFMARASKEQNKFENGFFDVNSKKAFVSSSPVKDDILLHNSKTGFFIENSGLMNAIKVRMAHSGQTKTINPNDHPVFLMTAAGDHQIGNPNLHSNSMCYVFNLNSTDILIGGQFNNPTVPGALSVPAHGMKVLFSDGGSWYHS